MVATANATPVNVLMVEPATSYQEVRTYSGTIVAARSSQLGFERAGEVVEISVDAGDRILAGTPLAFLDTRNLEASRRELMARRAQAVASLNEMLAGPRTETIAAAEASADNLRAQLDLAQQVSERRQNLFEEGVISREELDEAIAEVTALQASLRESMVQVDELRAGTRPEQIDAQNARIQELDANLARLNIDLDKSVLKAPFAGTIAARLIDEGTVVTAGQPIVELVENTNLEARIGVPILTASRLQIGQTQSLKIGQTDYSATVTAILPTLDSDTRTVTIVLALDASATADVAPGQVAQIELAETIELAGFWIPTTALIGGENGLWSCYVLSDSTGTNLSNETPGQQSVFAVSQQDVEVIYSESDRVLVRGTLSEGDRVIVDGNHRLVPGQLVYPVQDS
ncbi:MAG: efflux RND transporter periplasmic adaptor subunit [Elainellaceae cyanobacterium]